MAKITFEDKVATKQSSVPRINSIIDDDINEIKASINSLYDDIIFTSTERKTNRKWVDGKDIYENTLILEGGNIVSGISNNIKSIDISSLGVDTLFYDLSHSNLKVSPNNAITYQYPAICVGFNGSNVTNIKANSITILDFTNNNIRLFIGDTINSSISTAINSSLCLSIEYTKN